MSTSKPTSILVVDDDKQLTENLAELFRDEKWHATVAFSGQEAIDLYVIDPSDIVLLDLKMPPGMDGLEVIEKLKQHDPNVCVIFFTAFGNVDVAVKALQLGAVNMLEKRGMDFELIFAIVKKNLESHRESIEVQRLRQEQLRFQMLNALVLGLVHQLGNQVTSIGWSLGRLKILVEQRVELADYRTTVSDATSAGKRIDAILDELTNFAQSHEFNPTPVNLLVAINKSVYAAVSRHEHHMTRDRDYVLNVAVPANLVVRGHPVFLPMVFEALIVNALDEILAQGLPREISIRTELKDENVEIEFQDNGRGFSEQILHDGPRLFATTKSLTNYGIGLATAQQAVKQCGGSLTITNRPPPATGACVRVTLLEDYSAP